MDRRSTFDELNVLNFLLNSGAEAELGRGRFYVVKVQVLYHLG